MYFCEYFLVNYFNLVADVGNCYGSDFCARVFVVFCCLWPGSKRTIFYWVTTHE